MTGVAVLTGIVVAVVLAAIGVVVLGLSLCVMAAGADRRLAALTDQAAHEREEAL